MNKLKEAFGINGRVISEMQTRANTNLPMGKAFNNEHIEKIADAMNDLFCYRRIEGKPINPESPEWVGKIKAKGYTQDTKPRNNDPEILHHVTARHIVLIFNCFKGLHMLGDGIQDHIIHAFLDNVLEKQGWKTDPNITQDTLLAGIRATAKVMSDSFRMKGDQQPPLERFFSTSKQPLSRG